jgi:ABC-2 type transport system permease protein
MSISGHAEYHPSSLFLLLRYELIKIFFKWRTYIGFITLAVVIPLVEIALKLGGGTMVQNMTRNLSRDFLLIGNLFNAYWVTYTLMMSLWVHVPFLIALVAGDQLAGEATSGTVRLLLTRPASRSRILLSKYLAALVYAALLVIFLGAVGVGVGLILFGPGDLLVVGKEFTIIPSASVPTRLMLGFGLAVFSMWCVASLAFLFSSLVENAIGPIIATMAVIIVFFVIANLPIESLQAVRPYLFTTYMNIWMQAFEMPIRWGEIASSLMRLAGFSVGFYLVTWYIFVKKDVLS